MNYKSILGYATAFGVLGVTAFALYKYYRRDVEGDLIITAEEARSEIEFRRNAKMDEQSEEFEVMKDDIRDTAGFNRSFMGPMSTSDEEDEEEESVDGVTVLSVSINSEGSDNPLEELENDEELDADYSDVSEDEMSNNNEKKEGLKKLRHDPNSVDAREQFIDMEMADFDIHGDSYFMTRRLFDFPFVPTNDGDKDLRTKLIDNRVQFFGLGSKWIHEVTFADVMLYYAKSAVFHCDETIQYWMDYFFEFNGMDIGMSSSEFDDVIERLNTHIFYNDHTDTYGAFGLTIDAINNATAIAMRNIDTSLTYDIEFNEFLKMVN